MSDIISTSNSSDTLLIEDPKNLLRKVPLVNALIFSKSIFPLALISWIIRHLLAQRKQKLKSLLKKYLSVAQYTAQLIPLM